MHVHVSRQSQCNELYQRTNQIACQKIRWYLHQPGDMSDYCTLFSQTFYGLLFSYLTITDVTSYVHHKFPVSFVLYIATKKLNQIITVKSSANAPITHKKITLVRLACLCFFICCDSILRRLITRRRSSRKKNQCISQSKLDGGSF